MVRLVVRDRETIQEAVRRFRKLVERSGIKKEMRRREHYEKPSETKRRARLRAERRARRTRLLAAEHLDRARTLRVDRNEWECDAPSLLAAPHKVGVAIPLEQRLEGAALLLDDPQQLALLCKPLLPIDAALRGGR